MQGGRFINYKKRITISFIITLVLALFAYWAGANGIQPQIVAGVALVGFFACVFLEGYLAIAAVIVAMVAYGAGAGMNVPIQLFIALGALYVGVFIIRFLFEGLKFWQ